MTQIERAEVGGYFQNGIGAFVAVKIAAQNGVFVADADGKRTIEVNAVVLPAHADAPRAGIERRHHALIGHGKDIRGERGPHHVARVRRIPGVKVERKLCFQAAGERNAVVCDLDFRTLFRAVRGEIQRSYGVFVLLPVVGHDDGKGIRSEFGARILRRYGDKRRPRLFRKDHPVADLDDPALGISISHRLEIAFFGQHGNFEVQRLARRHLQPVGIGIEFVAVLVDERKFFELRPLDRQKIAAAVERIVGDHDADLVGVRTRTAQEVLVYLRDIDAHLRRAAQAADDGNGIIGKIVDGGRIDHREELDRLHIVIVVGIQVEIDRFIFLGVVHHADVVIGDVGNFVVDREGKAPGIPRYLLAVFVIDRAVERNVIFDVVFEVQIVRRNLDVNGAGTARDRFTDFVIGSAENDFARDRVGYDDFHALGAAQQARVNAVNLVDTVVAVADRDFIDR